MRRALPLFLLAIGSIAACGSEEEGGSGITLSQGAGGTAGDTGAGGDSGASGTGGTEGGMAGAATTEGAGGQSSGAGGTGTSGKAGTGAGGTGTSGTGGTGTSGTGGGTAGKGGTGTSGTGGTGTAGMGSGGCLNDITALGVEWKATKAKGVVDAVNLLGPINGVLFASGTKTTPAGDPIACEFVKTLYAAATVYKAHGFVRIGTLGSYCYRCCCAWSESNYCRGPNDPEPSCGSNGYSAHSWGRAMDVRYLYKADGTLYDINNAAHWVISGSGDTCGVGKAAQKGISLELYDTVCDMKDAKVFSTSLTPNYNSDHRNHWHLDIGQTGPAKGFTVKDLVLPQVDVSDSADACGDHSAGGGAPLPFASSP